MSNPNCGENGSCDGCPVIRAFDLDVINASESIAIGRAAFNLYSNNAEQATVVRQVDVILKSQGIESNAATKRMLLGAFTRQSTQVCK